MLFLEHTHIDTHIHNEEPNAMSFSRRGICEVVSNKIYNIDNKTTLLPAIYPAFKPALSSIKRNRNARIKYIFGAFFLKVGRLLANGFTLYDKAKRQQQQQQQWV